MSIRELMRKAYECAICGCVYPNESTAYHCVQNHQAHAALVAHHASYEYLTDEIRKRREELRCEYLDLQERLAEAERLYSE